MGSRGAFEKSGGTGISSEYREYSSIGTLNHIKIVQWNQGTNNKTITYSNTKNTTYFSFNQKNGRIEKIYYYRNHKLVKSVDMYDKAGPHIHYWKNGSVVSRKSHDPKNTFAMDERDTKLYNAAIKWNNGKR